jgi:hypothetical protein
LDEKIDWVMGELDGIHATGTNQFSATALSIGDVEGALRPLLSRAGIVIRFAYATDASGKARLDPIDKGLWQAQLQAAVSGGGEDFQEDWADIGGNPMAATSFARKGYLKALFHITEAGDETGSTPSPRKATTGRGAPSGNPPPKSAPAPSVNGSVASEALALFERCLAGEVEGGANMAWTALTKEGWKRGGDGPTRWIPAQPAERQMRILAALKGIAGDITTDPYDPEEIPFP